MLRIAIYTGIVLVAIATFAAAQYWTDQSDLWLNLFAEALGVAFTVLIVEKLIRIDDLRRTKPARYAAFMDALLIFNRFCSLWYDIVRTTFDPERHGKILANKDIKLLDNRFGEIIAILRLESDAPVSPKRTWKVHLKQQVEDLEQLIDRCLQRYAAFMEPELIKALQDFERSSFFAYGKLAQTFGLVDEELGLKPRPHFGWGGPATVKDLLVPLDRLGRLLTDIRPKFAGMPDVPSTIDVERLSHIEELRKMVADASVDNNANAVGNN